MEEEWKDIPGYEGYYKVSNMGNIKSFKRNIEKGTVLKTIMGKRGYPLINLTIDGKSSQFLIHRLVATCFLDNPDNLPIINHKDLNKTNNYVNNLEWCTYRDNVSHYYENTENISNFRGVYKQGNSYVTQIHIEGARYHIGSYKKEEVAQCVYKKAIDIYEKGGKNAFIMFKNTLDSKSSSKYKNVYFDKSRGKWLGSVVYRGKNILKKRFNTEEDAISRVINVYLEYGIPLHHTHLKYIEDTKNK